MKVLVVEPGKVPSTREIDGSLESILGAASDPGYDGMSWVDSYLAGKTSMDQIDNYIEYWHNNDTGGKTLPEFLGMTDQEYGRWLATGEDSTLREILDAHSAANGCVLQAGGMEPVQQAVTEPDWEPEF